MTARPTVLTIILNYKTAEMTLKSAAAARAAMEGIAGAITIVDNDSQDGSFETLSAHVRDQGWDADDRMQVLQSDRNGGFGAGNNVGIRAGLPGGARPDYVYILNSDAFPATDAIRALLDHLKPPPRRALPAAISTAPRATRTRPVSGFPPSPASSKQRPAPARSAGF